MIGILIMQKRDGEVWFCMDYQKLNQGLFADFLVLKSSSVYSNSLHICLGSLKPLRLTTNLVACAIGWYGIWFSLES